MLFRGPADIYMFSLFVFDLLQAIGGILNIRWAHKRDRHDRALLHSTRPCWTASRCPHIRSPGLPRLRFHYALGYHRLFWCWISLQFPREGLGGDFIWLWIALFASAILYIPLQVPLYFWAEGFWSVND
ncbi:hypothetical protein V8E52_000891 [Russula decolorans]